jgi:hypothetical protein
MPNHCADEVLGSSPSESYRFAVVDVDVVVGDRF